MRITTRLRAISSITLAALVVLAPVLIWSFVEFKSAKSDYALADKIKVNFFERASFRDQYFLYREDRSRMQWDKAKETADGLLRQAEVQFHDQEDQQVLQRLRRNIEDSANIFHRIVINTAVLKTAVGNRQVYEELDRRLSSQLLLKAAAIRDMATALQDASAWRVEQTYQHLTIIIGLFAVTLALTTILTSVQIVRLIRKRLAPLHDGAKIVADGNLDYRIECGGSDEFSELALSINTMTGTLQAFTKELVAEISAHKQTEDALRQSEDEVRKFNQELEQRVAERTAQLEAANEELKTFSYSVSHDLRAPLRALDGYTHVLREDEAGNLSTEGQDMLERIWKNSNKMGVLIDDILQFSRVGFADMNWKETDMAALARSVAEEMRGDYPAAQIRIANLPKAMGDEAMLRQAWANLIGNALKFSAKQEHPEIEICSEPLNGESVFYIRDNGAGFDMAHAEKLFGVFQRMHTENDFPGTGAGLSIVKRIVERHGGRIWAEAEVDKGATFRFTLAG